MASRQAIAKIKREVFGQFQKTNQGANVLKKRWTAILDNRYYPDHISDIARKTNPGYLTEKEERRQAKLRLLRSRGKGPPKKGSGKRKK